MTMHKHFDHAPRCLCGRCKNLRMRKHLRDASSENEFSETGTPLPELNGQLAGDPEEDDLPENELMTSAGPESYDVPPGTDKRRKHAIDRAKFERKRMNDIRAAMTAAAKAMWAKGK
jgi:hypothetical protein